MPRSTSRDAFIVGVLRTPYGQRGGALGRWHPVDLVAYLLSGVVARYGLSPEDVQDVLLGCVSQVGAQANNLARHAVLAAGWPEQVPGATVDRQTASSSQAVHWAAQAVLSRTQSVVVAGGVEVMSAVPLGATLAVPHTGRPYSPGLRARYEQTSSLCPPALAVEEVARRWHLSREQLDEWSVNSHQRAAVASSRTSAHILSVPSGPPHAGDGQAGDGGPERRSSKGRGGRAPIGAWLTADEAVKPSLTTEHARMFAPLFLEGGTGTAANVAPEGDGAAVVVVASAERVNALRLPPLARFVSFAVAAADISVWPTATIPATRGALEKAGLRADNIDHFEVHESSAAAVLAWLREIGVDPHRVNPRGGSLAYGSPHGAVGAGLFVGAVTALLQERQRHALVSVAGEGGVATACVIERC